MVGDAKTALLFLTPAPTGHFGLPGDWQIHLLCDNLLMSFVPMVSASLLCFVVQLADRTVIVTGIFTRRHRLYGTTGLTSGSYGLSYIIEGL